MAMGWLVWQLTGEEKVLGLVGALGAAPMTFLAIFGGLIAERFERRNIILFTQSTAAIMPALVAILLIFYPQSVTVSLLMLMVLIHGTVMAFDVPARQAFVVEMVGKEDLPNAVALNSLTFNLSRTVGPAVGGVLLFLFGAAACFLANAASYFLLVAALLMMKLPRMSLAQQRGARMRHPLGGFYYVVNRRHIGIALILVTAMSIFAWPLINIMPSLATRHFGQGLSASLNAAPAEGRTDQSPRAGTANHAQPEQPGQALPTTEAAEPDMAATPMEQTPGGLSAEQQSEAVDAKATAAAQAELSTKDEKRYTLIMSLFGFGAFSGAMTMAYVGRSKRRKPLIFLGISLYAAGVIGFTSTTNLLLAAVPLVLTGAGMLISLVAISSFIQMTVSDRFRGRVMGLYTFFFVGMMPAGSLVIGWLASWLGPARAIQVNLVAVLAVTVIVALLWLGADGDPRQNKAAGL